jgi:hypothetical protein
MKVDGTALGKTNFVHWQKHRGQGSPYENMMWKRPTQMFVLTATPSTAPIQCGMCDNDTDTQHPKRKMKMK